jgi:hypothetical protein
VPALPSTGQGPERGEQQKCDQSAWEITHKRAESGGPIKSNRPVAVWGYFRHSLRVQSSLRGIFLQIDCNCD